MLDFLELEETVGEVWHRLVGQTRSLPRYPEHAVALETGPRRDRAGGSDVPDLALDGRAVPHRRGRDAMTGPQRSEELVIGIAAIGSGRRRSAAEVAA